LREPITRDLALSPGPENPKGDPRLFLFLRHLSAGRKNEANKLLAEMLKSDPAQAAGYALLIGALLAQNGQFREALPLYKEAIRLNPDEPRAYLYLGVAHHALNDEAASNAVWDELSAKFAGHAADHYQRGLRLLRRNDFSKAKEELLKAAALLSPADPMHEDVTKTVRALDKQLSR
jgi:tetratricopeptide (TPR) repeat protein